MSTMVARPPHIVGGGVGYVYSNHEREYKYVELGKAKPGTGGNGWEYSGRERRRGRSQQVSRAALARRASEERRVVAGNEKEKVAGNGSKEGPHFIRQTRRSAIFATGETTKAVQPISVDNSPSLPPTTTTTSSTSTAPALEQDVEESPLDRLHLAYASDDMQLARKLVLELDGIIVDGEDDPRIAMVKDEDFDRHFLPQGGLKLDVSDVDGVHAHGPDSVISSKNGSASSCMASPHDKQHKLLYPYMNMPTRTSTTARLPTSTSAPPLPKPQTQSMHRQHQSIKGNCVVSAEDIRRSLNGPLFPDDPTLFPTHHHSPSPSSSIMSSSTSSSVAHKKRRTQLSLLSTLLDDPAVLPDLPSTSRVGGRYGGSCDTCKSRKAYLKAMSASAAAGVPSSSSEPSAPTKQRSGLWLAFRSYATSTATVQTAPHDSTPSSTSSISSISSTSSTSSNASQTSNASSLITTPATSPCTSPPSMSPSIPPALLPTLELDDSKAFFTQSPPLLAKSKSSGFSWMSWLRPTSTASPPSTIPDGSFEGAFNKCSCPKHMEKQLVRPGECPLSYGHPPSAPISTDNEKNMGDSDNESASSLAGSPPSSPSSNQPTSYSISLLSISTQIYEFRRVLQNFSQLNAAYVNAVVGMSDDDVGNISAGTSRGSVVYGVSGRRGAAIGLNSTPTYSGGGMGMMARMGMGGSGFAGYGFSGAQPVPRHKGMMNLGVRDENIYRPNRAARHSNQPIPASPLRMPPHPPVARPGRVRVRKKRSGFRASREDVIRVFNPVTTRGSMLSAHPSPPPSPTTPSPADPASGTASSGFMEDDGVVDIDAVDIPLVVIVRGRKSIASKSALEDTKRGRAWQRRGYSGYSPYAHAAEYALTRIAEAPSATTSSEDDNEKSRTSTTPATPQYTYLRPVANPVYLRLKAVKNTVSRKGVLPFSGEPKTSVDVDVNVQAIATAAASRSSDELVSEKEPQSPPSPPSTTSPSAPGKNGSTEDPALSINIGVTVRVRSGSMGSGKERVCGVGGGGRGRSMLCFGVLHGTLEPQEVH